MSAIQNAKDAKRDEKKAAAASKSKSANSEWKGFITLELTDGQKTEVKALQADADRVFDNVFSLIDDGYKISFSYDAFHDMYICSATGKNPKSPNNGLTLTGRGGKILGAMASLWYKHDVVTERVWGEPENHRKRDVSEEDVG